MVVFGISCEIDRLLIDRRALFDCNSSKGADYVTGSLHKYVIRGLMKMTSLRPGGRGG